MLAVSDLGAGYGPITALEQVSFAAPRGRITAVLGANGAGKTTLLRSISGLHPCRTGTVELDGRRIERLPAERMPGLGLSHVPEGRGVITELTVEENLRLGALARGRVRPADLDRVYSLFPAVADRRHAPGHTLSGGERQMLVIGRALMASPELLLLDEPSLGLAPRIVARIFELLRRTDPRRRPHHPARRAERPQRALGRRPRSGAQPRSGGGGRGRRRAGRGRPAPPRLPRLLTRGDPCSS